PAGTPAATSPMLDHSFTLQAVMDLKGTVSSLGTKVDRLIDDVGKQGDKIDTIRNQISFVKGRCGLSADCWHSLWQGWCSMRDSRRQYIKPPGRVANSRKNRRSACCASPAPRRDQPGCRSDRGGAPPATRPLART